jgi:hypothetical protein
MDNGTPGEKPPAPSVSEPTGLTLILRRTYVHARVAGWDPKIWSHDDYCILDGERVVGRIYPELTRRTEVAVVPSDRTCAAT